MSGTFEIIAMNVHWKKLVCCFALSCYIFALFNCAVQYLNCIGCWFFMVHSIILKGIIVIMEKAMAPHSSTFAEKIPWTEEPGRLQSMGLLRVGHD